MSDLIVVKFKDPKVIPRIEKLSKFFEISTTFLDTTEELLDKADD
ncbi:MAG: hypothetical protein ACOYOK_12065 [Pseudobdellovibrionaceae bacterium]